MAEVPWTWFIIRGSGMTAWALLTAVMVYGLVLRSRSLNMRVKPLTLLTMHRWLGALAVTALAVHMLTLLVDPVVRFTPLHLLVPFTSSWEPGAVALGVAAFWLVIPVTIVGRIRVRLGKRGNVAFKRAHLYAYAAWPLATMHYVLAGTDAMTRWSLVLLSVGVASVVFTLILRGYFEPPTRNPAVRKVPDVERV